MIRSFNELNRANETGNGVQLNGTKFVPVSKVHCDEGPIQIVHQVHPNMFVSPVPLRYTCKGLYCKDPECLPRRKIRVCQWGVSYTIRQIRGGFVVSKPQIRRVCYETQLQCSCKICEDFRTQNECNTITPCPNLQFPNQTNCYWVNPNIIQFDIDTEKSRIIPPLKGRCTCCTKSCIHPLFLNQKTCKCECDLNQACPSPKILDPNTCKCRCPDGSKEDTTTGNCTGNCKRFRRSELCKEIFCETNPSQLCTLINRKCDCPKTNVTIMSCDEISDPVECNRTVCPGTNFSPPIMCK